MIHVSRDLSNKARSLGGASWQETPSDVQAMGVDTAFFGATAPPEPRRGRLRVLAVGRLVDLKGYDDLIEAVRSLDGVEVAIAGAGPRRGEMERQAADAPVRFLGHLGPAGLRNALGESDVLVVPSRRGAGNRTEGMPVVIGEAMAAGRPVVGTTTGGIPDVIRPGENGELFEPGDIGALTRTLVRLRDDDALRSRLSAGAARSAPSFSHDVVAARFEEILDAARTARTAGAR